MSPTNPIPVMPHHELIGYQLFRLISYDAGGCSLENAIAVRGCGQHYVLGLQGTQPTLVLEAERLLGGLGPPPAVASSEDAIGGGPTVIRRAYVTDAMQGFAGWDQLRTVIRVESETLDASGRRTKYDNRYFVSGAALAERRWCVPASSKRGGGAQSRCEGSAGGGRVGFCPPPRLARLRRAVATAPTQQGYTETRKLARAGRRRP